MQSVNLAVQNVGPVGWCWLIIDHTRSYKLYSMTVLGAEKFEVGLLRSHDSWFIACYRRYEGLESIIDDNEGELRIVIQN